MLFGRWRVERTALALLALAWLVLAELEQPAAAATNASTDEVAGASTSDGLNTTGNATVPWEQVLGEVPLVVQLDEQVANGTASAVVESTTSSTALDGNTSADSEATSTTLDASASPSASESPTTSSAESSPATITTTTTVDAAASGTEAASSSSATEATPAAATETPTAEFLSFNEWREKYAAPNDKKRSLGRRAKKAASKDGQDGGGDEVGKTQIVYEGHGTEGPLVVQLDSSGNVESAVLLEPTRPAVARDAAPTNGGGRDLVVGGQQSPIQPLPHVATGTDLDPLKELKDRTNYALADCAAKVHKSSSSTKNAKSILVEKKDVYMLTPCSTESKFVELELCDEIQIDTVVLANYEFFSSMFKHFTIRVSTEYPGRPDQWHLLGTYRARNIRGVQVFRSTDLLDFYRYMRIDFLSHYGSEYYCPVSLLRVYGLTEMQSYRRTEERKLAMQAMDILPDDDTLLEDDEGLDDFGSQDVEEDEPQTTKFEETRPVATESETTTTTASVAEASTTAAVSTSPDSSTSAVSSEGSSLPASSSASPASSTTTSVEATPTPPSSESTAVSSDGASNATVSEATASPTASATSGVSVSETLNATASVSSESSAATTQEASDSVSASASPTATTVTLASSSSAVTATATVTRPSGVPRGQGRDDRASGGGSTGPQREAGESIYGAIMKRITNLERNQTLAMQYIEAQSAMLREVFSRYEKRLDGVEGSRTQYEELVKHALLELDGRRAELERDRLEIISRVNLLAQDNVVSKRLGIAQLVALLALFIFVGVTRGSSSTPFLQLVPAHRLRSRRRAAAEEPSASTTADSEANSSQVKIGDAAARMRSARPGSIKRPSVSTKGAPRRHYATSGVSKTPRPIRSWTPPPPSSLHPPEDVMGYSSDTRPFSELLRKRTGSTELSDDTPLLRQSKLLAVDTLKASPQLDPPLPIVDSPVAFPGGSPRKGFSDEDGGYHTYSSDDPESPVVTHHTDRRPSATKLFNRPPKATPPRRPATSHGTAPRNSFMPVEDSTITPRPPERSPSPLTGLGVNGLSPSLHKS